MENGDAVADKVKEDLMSEKMTRRGFVAGAAALATGALAMGAGAGFALAEEIENWDYETEVLCIGSGATGASAAVAAGTEGAQVLVIEKDSLPGGSMSRCGGGMQGAGTKVQEECGVEDSVEDFYEWVKFCVGDYCPDDIVRKFSEDSAKTIDWLNELNVQYVGTELFEAEITMDRSRGLNSFGTDFSALGTTPPPRSHWTTIDPTTWPNYETITGDPIGGPQLYNAFYQAMLAMDNIEIMLETPMKRFIRNANGEVVGVIAEQAGKEITIKAKKGVVCGCGGFPNGPEMKEKFVPDQRDVTSEMSPLCVGDGVRAMMALGADLTQMSYCYPIETGKVFDYDPAFEGIFPMWLASENDPNEMVLPSPYLAETHGGVVINVNAEVQDVWGETIPRLYASGCDVGTNVFGKPGNYPGCGTYVTFSVTFGRVAGQNAAALPNWDE